MFLPLFSCFFSCCCCCCLLSMLLDRYKDNNNNKQQQHTAESTTKNYLPTSVAHNAEHAALLIITTLMRGQGQKYLCNNKRSREYMHQNTCGAAVFTRFRYHPALYCYNYVLLYSCCTGIAQRVYKPRRQLISRNKSYSK